MYALLTAACNTCHRLENIRFRQFKSSASLTITSKREASLVDRKLSKSNRNIFLSAVRSWDKEQIMTLRAWKSGVSRNYLSKRELNISGKFTRNASVKPEDSFTSVEQAGGK